jgi:hypothetical protein
VGEPVDLVAPRLRAEPLLQERPPAGVEDEEVDLVRVLVHDRRPREAARREQVAVEPDVARRRVGGAEAADVDGDPLRNDAPVERARLERGAHGRALGGRRVREDVVAAAREGGAGESERCRNGCLKPTDHLLQWSAAAVSGPIPAVARPESRFGGARVTRSGDGATRSAGAEPRTGR